MNDNPFTLRRSGNGSIIGEWIDTGQTLPFPSSDSFAYGNGAFVAMHSSAGDGTYRISFNGLDFMSFPFPTSMIELNFRLKFINGFFFAYSSTTTSGTPRHKIFRSQNGIDWIGLGPQIESNIPAVAFGSGRLIFVSNIITGTNRFIQSSDNMDTFKYLDGPAFGLATEHLVFGNGVFAGLRSSISSGTAWQNALVVGQLNTSTGDIEFTTHAFPQDLAYGRFTNIRFSHGVFIAVMGIASGLSSFNGKTLVFNKHPLDPWVEMKTPTDLYGFNPRFHFNGVQYCTFIDNKLALSGQVFCSMYRDLSFAINSNPIVIMNHAFGNGVVIGLMPGPPRSIFVSGSPIEAWPIGAGLQV
jgi:hypothetical protein